MSPDLGSQLWQFLVEIEAWTSVGFLFLRLFILLCLLNIFVSDNRCVAGGYIVPQAPFGADSD